MKKQHRKWKSAIQPHLLLIPVGLALLCSAGVSMGQDLIINTFDSGISGTDWQSFRSYAYGYNEVWDPAQDADGNPNSGSMYLSVYWPTNGDPNWNNSWNDVQIAFTGIPQGTKAGPDPSIFRRNSTGCGGSALRIFSSFCLAV